MTRSAHWRQSASWFFLVVRDLSREGSPNSRAVSKSVGVPGSTEGDCSLSTYIPQTFFFGNRSRSQLNQTLGFTCLRPVLRGLEGRSKKTYCNSSRGLGVLHTSIFYTSPFFSRLERSWWVVGERQHLVVLSGRRFTRLPFRSADSSVRCASPGGPGSALPRGVTAPSRGSRTATGMLALLAKPA